MSLVINNYSAPGWNMLDGPGNEYNDAKLLDRYLAIMEANKASSRFVPNDALLALDMAGFVHGQVNGHLPKPGISTARLALALVQPVMQPVQ